MLRLAINNLIQNAWKFTSKKQKAVIEFGITEHNGKRACFIRDNGVGFSRAHAERIFIPFQRLHTTSDFPGSGVRLAIVKRVMEKHGGSVWAVGEPDKGVTVYFSLPGQ